ncbi:MAG TPA: cellulase family glycosylhydrolase, partial [Planctomycetota bacterium]|nr:cellulase family glycosylhydrolase [Planctomycetota bacterium]
MKLLLLLFVTYALTLCCGAASGDSEKSDPPKPDTGVLPIRGLALLDGFEGPEHTLWAFDSADDEGIASYVEDGASQGKKALKVTLREKGAKGKIHLRRDVELDLSRASALVLDVTSPASGVSMALALKNEPGDIWQEAVPVTLKKGLNRDVRISLDGENWKNEKTRWEYNGPPVNLDKTKRLILLLFTGDEESGSFLFDNLRIEGEFDDKKQPGSGRVFYREWRPEIVFSTPIPQAASQFSGIEQQIVFRASYRDIFDPTEIIVGWRVTTPSGRNIDVRGFFGGLARGKVPEQPEAAAPAPLWGPFFLPSDRLNKEAPPKPDQLPQGVVPVWVIRFTPHEVGRYTVQPYLKNSAGETRRPEVSFVVAAEKPEAAPPGRRAGNVKVSRKDPSKLELQDGAPFFIFGQNVAWSQNFTPYLEKIKAYGGNTCRIWLCPWGISLERKMDIGAYDLKEAERIDKLIAQAEANGVRIMFCFTFHGATAEVWHESPYNNANGGPCSRPEDFFIDTRARRYFKRLLSYCVTRWGSSPAILSWELMNEFDLAKFDNNEDMANWTREMAAHLKNVDPYGHIVTTSVSKPGFLSSIWNDANIDWINVHAYGADVSNLLRESLDPLRKHHKPLLIGEYGAGWRPQDDPPDKEGVRLQAA